MRQDQYERLQQLEEKLLDVAIDEAQPEAWPGAGLQAAAMDKNTRGDRYWCKRNAVATISLAQRIGALVGGAQMGGGTTPPAAVPEGGEEADVDREIDRFEAEATTLLKNISSGAARTMPKRGQGKK